MGVGYLTVTVHTADDALPVANAQVIIKNNEGEVLYQAVSNENGYTESFALTTPDKSLTLDPNYGKPAYSTVTVDVIKDGFITKHVYGVEILDEQTSILPVNLRPQTTDIEPDEEIYIPPIGLLLPDQGQIGGEPFVLREVLIPEYITVHLGAPTNAAARNVRVRFPEYIKNVVSSEIYATWPHNALMANTHTIVTFAINRVYTEWYRSRGFNFDITNSTAYDQYFVEGRNIYQNISIIVDEYFNVYARRFGYINPFFTQFCNGTTVTCAGLSQWGTVDLANRGYTPIQILHYYYPDDLELVASNNIGAITESFPGYNLSAGAAGPSVQIMQNFLNRIRVNYPLIPQITNPNGVFGPETDAAVRTFQRTFNLTADGVVGRATWNKISFIFVGVTRLAELNSEGQRIGISRTPPTITISEGSRGENVLHLQFILSAIEPYYEAIPSVIKDGVFGSDTKNAVIQFQKTFGLTQDGVVGPATWAKLYAVYWGIYDNVEIPSVELPIPDNAPPFPGELLRIGSSGPNVRLMQTYLNVIRTVYPSIPQLVVDSVFGNETRNAVIAFQQQFLLSPDGIIGPVTWAKIVEQFLLLTGNISISTEFPGILRLGSTGSGVRLLQTFLTELRSVYPALPSVGNIDGIFGSMTRTAVLAFQNMFGLVADGIVGPLTWDSIVYQRNLHFGV